MDDFLSKSIRAVRNGDLFIYYNYPQPGVVGGAWSISLQAQSDKYMAILGLSIESDPGITAWLSEWNVAPPYPGFTSGDGGGVDSGLQTDLDDYCFSPKNNSYPQAFDVRESADAASPVGEPGNERAIEVSEPLEANQKIGLLAERWIFETSSEFEDVLKKQNSNLLPLIVISPGNWFEYRCDDPGSGKDTTNMAKVVLFGSMFE